MNSKPRIIVLKLREIIYTLMLLFLVVLLVICLILMFSGKAKKSGAQSSTSAETSAAQDTEASPETGSYTPGVYTTPVTLGNSTVDVEVTVDSGHINSIRLVNLSETAAAAYPLVSPSLEHIASQILEKQSLEEITSPQENRYTSQLLLSAVSKALEMAKKAG